MSRVAPNASFGGGNAIIPADERHIVRVPQYGIDVALAQAAFVKIDRQIRCMRGEGRVPSPKMYSWLWVMRDTCRSVGRTGRPLSNRMRAACIKSVGEQVYARILKANTDSDVPAVLRELPKKPPVRKIQDDETNSE